MRARALPLALALCALTPAARAQSGALRGWALSRFEPAPAGDPFVVAEHPWYAPHHVAAGLVVDYALAPLTLRREYAASAPREDGVVAGMFTAHAVVSAAFWDRVGVHLSLPLSLYQHGVADPTMATRLGPADGPSLGDLRVGARARILGDSDRTPFSLHLGALLWIPTGTPEANTGDGEPRGEFRAALAGRISLLRWAFGAALALRREFASGNILGGDELGFTAGVGLVLLDGRLQVGVESALRTLVRGLPTAMGGGSAAFTRDAWGGEALLSARYTVARAVALGLAGGFGYGEAPGTPAARFVVSAQYAPLSAAPRAR